MTLPAWLAWVIAGAGLVGLGIPATLAVLRQRKRDAEFLIPPGKLHIKVSVRGPGGVPVDPARFALCWNTAFDALANSGPWARDLLVARLGPGSRVQVMPTDRWKGSSGELVGGELLADLLCVTPSLDSLAHELIHRAEQVLEHGETDNAHATWRRRGLASADETYRAWLKG